jgi:hypothetical protein
MIVGSIWRLRLVQHVVMLRISLLPDVCIPRLACVKLLRTAIGGINGWGKSGNDEFEERANTG